MIALCSERQFCPATEISETYVANGWFSALRPLVHYAANDRTEPIVQDAALHTFFAVRAETGLSPQVRTNYVETSGADIQTTLKRRNSLHRRMTAQSPEQ